MSNVKKNTLLSYIILLFYIIYEMRGVTYQEGSFLSKSMVVVVIFCGFICMLVNMGILVRKILPKIHILFILIVSLYWIVSPSEVNGVIGEAIGIRPTWDFLKCFLYANISFYTFFHICIHSSIGYKHITVWCIIIAILKLFQMYAMRAQIMYEALYNIQGVQMAAGYVFAGLIAYTMFIERNFYRVCVCTFLLVCVFLSVKRGAIMLGSIFYIWIIYETYFNNKKKVKISNIFVAIVILLIVGYGVIEYVSNNEFIMRRLDKTLEGDASNREDMYPMMMGIVYNSSLFDIVLGHGMIQTVTLIGNYAHNDWFETVIDFGIIPLVLLFLFFVCFYHFCKEASGSVRKVLYMTFVFLLFKSFVSMGIYSLESYFQIGVLGYIYADTKILRIKPDKNSFAYKI